MNLLDEQSSSEVRPKRVLQEEHCPAGRTDCLVGHQAGGEQRGGPLEEELGKTIVPCAPAGQGAAASALEERVVVFVLLGLVYKGSAVNYKG